MVSSCGIGGKWKNKENKMKNEENEKNTHEGEDHRRAHPTIGSLENATRIGRGSANGLDH